MSGSPTPPPPDLLGWLLEAVSQTVREVVREEIASLRDEIVSSGGGSSSTERLMTVAEAAGYARVKEATIREWINEGKLPALQAGNRWRIRPGDLEAAMAPAGGTAVNLDAEADNIIRLGRKRRDGHG